MNDALNSAATDDEVLIHQSEGCSRCQNGQFMSYGKRLCDYGVQAVPISAMRHPMGLCGPEAKLFKPKKRYAEFDE